MQAPNFDKFKEYFNRKPFIKEIVKELTSGGIVFRVTPAKKVEILLIQDPKGRWSIPKGHIEEGEQAEQTAVREIGEEVNLTDVKVMGWLGKTHFRYRRVSTLVLMTTQVYLVHAQSGTDQVKKEEFYAGIKWFPFEEALDAVEYEDISKLMLLAMKKIRGSGMLAK
jgi:8-oxo-dGTP pyrophosphatase MutT (NUDIX family)